jgi:hypothetical protein
VRLTQIIYSDVDSLPEGLIQSKLDALGNGLGDSSSNYLVNFFLDSLGWVGGNLKGFTVKKFSFEAEVVSTSFLASVGASEEGLVSTLAVFLVFVSSEAKGSGQLFSALLHLALILGHGTRKFIVVVGASLDDVLGSGVTAVASGLLHLGLLLQGWDDGFSDVAGLEVGVHSGGIGVDKLVVVSSAALFVNAEDVVLELVFWDELVGEVTESVVLEWLRLGQVPSGDCSKSTLGNILSIFVLVLCILNIVDIWVSVVCFGVPSVGVGVFIRVSLSTVIASFGDG